MGKGSENKLDDDGASADNSVPILASSAALSNAATGNGSGNKTAYFEWDEVRKHNKKDDMWIVINDKVYDVTKFKHTHPGGARILEFYAGQDATEPFHAFHKELDRVWKRAPHYMIGKVRPANVGESKEAEIRRDFIELRHLASQMNLFKASYTFFFLHGLHILFLHVLGYYILWNYSDSQLGMLASIMCLVVSQTQASWTQHDYGHSSLFEKPIYNRYMQALFLGAVKGASPEWWALTHNLHHAKPNVVYKDPDVKVDPLLIFGEAQVQKRAQKDAKKRSYLYSYDKQHILFPFVAPLLFPLVFPFKSFQYVFTRKRYMELIYVAPFLISNFTITYLIFGSMLRAYLFTFLVKAIESTWFTWVSQCSHITMDIHTDIENDTWLNIQLTGTCNMDSSWFNDWFTGHLNYQIEHHLFPTMPRHNLYKIQPYVKSLCQKHNIKYVTKPMSQAFLDIILSLQKTGALWREAYDELTVENN